MRYHEKGIVNAVKTMTFSTLFENRQENRVSTFQYDLMISHQRLAIADSSVLVISNYDQGNVDMPRAK